MLSFVVFFCATASNRYGRVVTISLRSDKELSWGCSSALVSSQDECVLLCNKIFLSSTTNAPVRHRWVSISSKRVSVIINNARSHVGGLQTEHWNPFEPEHGFKMLSL